MTKRALFRRIVVATDFSSASSPAFVKALEIARATGAELLVAHVLAPLAPVGVDGYVPPKMYQEMEEAVRSFSERKMKALLEKAAAARVRATALLLEGVTAETIVGAASRRRADLIVLGTHGRTGLARAILGSVASRVAAEAKCPVLTVRGRR